MRDRWWLVFLLILINGIIWLGWDFALYFTIWLFAFISLAIKDKLMQRKARGSPGLLSNMWVKMALIMIVVIILIFVVILPLIFALELIFACRCWPF